MYFKISLSVISIKLLNNWEQEFDLKKQNSYESSCQIARHSGQWFIKIIFLKVCAN